MSEPHPQLCLRPRPHPSLQRPTLQHPVLGTLAYVNRDGGWWQGTTILSGVPVRLDLQRGANVTSADLQAATELVQWLQDHEEDRRAHVAESLMTGDFDPVRPQDRDVRLEDPDTLLDLCPCLLVVWSDRADLHCDCTVLSGGTLLGAHVLEVVVGSAPAFQDVLLRAQSLSTRARYFLERPQPPIDFVDSLADQFIAAVAERGTVRFDTELKDRIEREIVAVEEQIISSPHHAAYLKSARALLKDIAGLAQTAMATFQVSLDVRHPAGKAVPAAAFVKKLAAPDDGVSLLHRSEFVRATLASLEGEVATRPERLREGLAIAAQWLAKQSPELFQGIRTAGFTTIIDLWIEARIALEPLEVALPPEFLAECARLGLTVSSRTILADAAAD